MAEHEVADLPIDEASLAQMLANIEAAPEPGTLRVKDVLHRGDGDVPMPIVNSTLSSAGYTRIYNTKTGLAKLTNNNMLMAQLKKKHPADAGPEWVGKPAFTTIKPAVEPVAGKTKCLLHPDDPDRALYDEMGLPTCQKANLMNAFQRNQHVKNRHPGSWRAIQEYRAEREKAEERTFQRELILAAKGAPVAAAESARSKKEG